MDKPIIVKCKIIRLAEIEMSPQEDKDIIYKLFGKIYIYEKVNSVNNNENNYDIEYRIEYFPSDSEFRSSRIEIDFLNGIKYVFKTFCELDINEYSQELMFEHIESDLVDEYEKNMKELLIDIKETIENNLYDDLKTAKPKIIKF